MPLVGRIFGGLDFSNYFIVLAPPPANYAGPMTYEALTKAGVPLFAYGNFLTVLLNFLILAFVDLSDGQADQPPAPRSRAATAGDAGGHRPAARNPRLAAPLTVPLAWRRALRERDAVPRLACVLWPHTRRIIALLRGIRRPVGPTLR